MTPARWKIASALLCVVVAGCAVNQETEVATYRRVLDGLNSPAVAYRPGDALSLDTALLLANSNNEQLALSGEDYLQALIDKDRAAASFLPTISLVPSYSLADKSNDLKSAASTGGTGTGGTGTVTSATVANAGSNKFDLPINGRINLFNGFQDVANIRRAAATIEQRRALLLDLQAAVMLDVARTYYQVLRSERSVEVLRNSVQYQNERVRDVRGRQRAGVARPLDVAQTEAQAAAERVSLIAAESDVRNGRTTLAYLVDAPVQNAPLVDQLDVPAQMPDPDVLTELAESLRLDLAAAASAVEAARQNVQAAIGQYYPSISLNANYFLHRESIPTDSEWNALFSANLPIFTGGIIHANVREAWSRFRQARLEEAQTRRLIQQDVQLAYENFTASGHRLEELRVEVTAAQEALRQAEQTYNAGLATNLERVAAQDRLLSAQLDLASEQFNRKVSYLNLLRIVGRLGVLSQHLPLDIPSGPASTRPATQPATQATTAPAPMYP